MNWLGLQKLTLGWAALMLAVFAFFVERPRQVELRRLRLALEQARADSLSDPQLAREEESLNAQVSLGEAGRQRRQRRVPPSDQMGAFLEQVMTIAEQYKLHGTSVEPLAAWDGADVRVLPLRLSFFCGSQELFGFLRELDHLDRAVHVRVLEARSPAAPPDFGADLADEGSDDATAGEAEASAPGDVRVSMMMEVYRRMPESP